MAERLRLCSGAEAVRKFERAGWTIAGQRGSHVMMVKRGYAYTLSVPQHNELARIIHEGSSRNRAVATRDRRAEP